MKCFWLLNHTPSPLQIDELVNRFGVSDIVFPSQTFAAVWSELPTGDVLYPDLVDSWIDSISAPDIAIVQGDSTYTFYIVDALLEKGVRVFAATTERVVKETIHGDKVNISRIFMHKAFREYRRRESKNISTGGNLCNILNHI